MASLSSLVRIVVGLVFLAVTALAFSLLCLPLLPWRHLRLKVTNVFGHIAGRGCLWLGGVHVPADLPERVRAHYPALYVANHTSLMDIFIATWLSPTGTCGVAKKEVIYYPFMGQIWFISGHLMVDRKNVVNAVTAMAKAAGMVARHHLGIWMWPEGTRSRDGRLQPFKKGFAHLALATKLPIVPVALSGVEKAWTKGSLRIQPCRLTATVLPPISTAHWTEANLEQHIQEVHDALRAALPEAQRPLLPPPPPPAVVSAPARRKEASPAAPAP